MEPKETKPSVAQLFAMNIIAVVGCFIFGIITASNLPERYPGHTNLAGEVDRWADKGSGEWLIMPILAAVMAALMVGVAFWLPRIPISYWNVPRKKEFLELTPEERTPVVRMLVAWVLALTLVQTLSFFAIHVTMYLTAMGGPETIGWIGVGAVVIAYGVVLWKGVVRTKRLIHAALDARQGNGIESQKSQ